MYFILKFELSLLPIIIAPIIVILKHKENIKRIFKGEENSRNELNKLVFYNFFRTSW